jgi:hypothetical protein
MTLINDPLSISTEGVWSLAGFFNDPLMLSTWYFVLAEFDNTPLVGDEEMTITHVELVNRLLRKSGETIVASVLANSKAEIASQCINDAIITLAKENVNWPFLEHIAEADSWINEKATLDSDIIHVHRILDANRRPIPYVSFEAFSRLASQGYTTAGTHPRWYAIFGEGFYFSPYPANEVEQSKIKFHVARLPQELVADEDSLTWGRIYINLLITRAAASFAIEFMNDQVKARQFASEFERYLPRDKTRFSNHKDRSSSIIF